MTIKEIESLNIGDKIYFICDGSEYIIKDNYCYKFLSNNKDNFTACREFAEDMKERMRYIDYEE